MAVDEADLEVIEAAVLSTFRGLAEQVGDGDDIVVLNTVGLVVHRPNVKLAENLLEEAKVAEGWCDHQHGEMNGPQCCATRELAGLLRQAARYANPKLYLPVKVDSIGPNRPWDPHFPVKVGQVIEFEGRSMRVVEVAPAHVTLHPVEP